MLILSYQAAGRKAPDVAAYTAVIDAFAKRGEAAEALLTTLCC